MSDPNINPFWVIPTVWCFLLSQFLHKRVWGSQLPAPCDKSHNFRNTGGEQSSLSPGPSQLPLLCQQAGLLPKVPQQSRATWLTLPNSLVIRDQHPRRLQLLPGLYWSQTLQPLPWVLLGKLVPNHPAPSYSIKNVYNPVNSNISAACYGGKRSLGEKGRKKKLPFHWKFWLGTDEGVSTRKISFDMIKSHNRKCCCNTGLVSSDKYLI